VGVRVRNIGTRPVDQSVSVDLFASADEMLDGADAAVATATVRLKLKPGRSKSVRLTFTSPQRLAEQPYHLLAVVDRGGAVVEADETNNVAASAGVVRISPGFMDLAATLPAVPPAALGTEADATAADATAAV
jgi:subtilase family serine protease